jgi:hypothetical protein
MLMIWSSRARNRSPAPVVARFLGRIAADAGLQCLACQSAACLIIIMAPALLVDRPLSLRLRLPEKML